MHSDSDTLYRRLIDSVADYAIFGLDAAGAVLTWHPGAERTHGYAAGEIVGRPFEVLYPPEEAAAGTPARELQMAARDGRFEVEGWRVHQDGSRFWANVALSAVYDDARNVVGFSIVTRDRSERRGMEEALRQSEERFRLLVHSVQDYAILMLDPEGRVTSWNEGAHRIKGYSAAEIIGRSFKVFYPNEAIAIGFPERELEEAARYGRFEDEDWRVRKDGTRFWANVIITALRNSEGKLIGFAKVTRDLTARRQAEEQALQLAAQQAAHAEEARRSRELAQLNEQLQEQAAELEAQTEEAKVLAEQLQQVNYDLQSALTAAESAREYAERSAAAATEAYRELDQFAYVASHDLKAPLRGIANLAQWIQDDAADSLGADSAEHMRLLQSRVRRMEALIDGILAYSRAGRAASEPEIIDTGALLRDVIELLGPSEAVTFRTPEHMPTLQAERIPLQQVFMNLLSNAIKYSSAERPDVFISVECRDRGDELEFAVIDNGPGIAPQYHDRIWGIFQTLAARDKVEGTGIGLSVVKKVVESRGGRVTLESSPGEGATFRFAWPKTARQGAPA